MRFTCYATCLAVLLSGCATKPPLKDPELFQQGRYQEVLERQCTALQQVRRREDWPLAQVKSASAHLASRDYGAAEQCLSTANSAMWVFDGDKEAEAFRQGEKEKVFKGDPFERAMVAFYLGILDYKSGKYDNALASCKTGLLADGGSKEERYQSDFAALYYLQSLVYRALGESDNATQAENLFRASLLSRISLDVARSTVKAVFGDMSKTPAQFKEAELVEATELLFAQLAQMPTDPGDLPSKLLSTAFFRARTIAERRAADAASTAASDDSQCDWGLAAHYLSLIEGKCNSRIRSIGEGRYAKYLDSAQNDLNALLSDPGNVSVVIDLGIGPTKIAAGSRGERAIICPQPYVEKRAKVEVSGRTYESIMIEDLNFQAATRGGRRMDFVLRDRAVYKDTSDAIGSYLAVTSIYTLPIAGLIYLGSSTVNAAADTRVWDVLPGEVHAVNLNLEPGVYRLDVRFFDALGSELPEMRQIIKECEVVKDRPVLWYIRSGRRTMENQPL